jgi:predicted YcjX-like family ATPase
MLNAINPLNHKARIGVVGFGRAGKTVFLTSLINHLKHHDHKNFKLNNTDIIGFREKKHLSEKGFDKKFDYDKFRAKFSEGNWPDSTKIASKYGLTFTTKLSNRDKNMLYSPYYDLTLYDIPGERIADLEIYGCDYSTWSEQQLEFLKNFSEQQLEFAKNSSEKKKYEECHKKITSFLDCVSQNAVEPQKIINAYKIALASIWDVFGHFITPSSLPLRHDGKNIKEMREELRSMKTSDIDFDNYIIKECLVGDLGAEFTPVSPTAENHDLFVQFKKNYDTYRSKNVYPLFRTLHSCDGLVVLIDLAEILERGVHLYNDSMKLLNNIFEMLNPTNTWLKAVVRPLGICRLRKIAIVASQCDRFHLNDWDCLEKLVGSFSSEMKRKFPNAENKSFVCSAAILAGECSDHDESKLAFKTDSGVEEKFDVSRISDDSRFESGDWPDNWQAGDIKIRRFKKVYIPKRMNTAPKQHNLNDVFCYITNWFKIESDKK